jgi:hypothetical protein
MPDPIKTAAPAAPAAPATPPPTPVLPAPVATPSPAEADPFEADFAAGANEAVSGTPPGPAAPAAPVAPAAPAAPAKPATPAAPAKPAAAPKPGDRPKEPKELRAELDRAYAERDTLKSQQAALEKRIADAEAKGKDTAALAERATALEKTIAERDAELRMLKQEASPEFKEKYEKPFTEAAEYAREVVEQLTVTEDNTIRPAKWEDFSALYNQPYSKAIEQATAMFGPAAQVVINHLTELHRLESVKNRALKSERDQAAVRMKDEEGRRVQSREATNAALAKLAEELPQKYEEYRDPPEDKELADARAKGYALFDAQPKTPQQAMVKFAHIRQRVAAFRPLLTQVSRLKAEVARLQAELDGKTLKEPQGGRRPGGTEQGGGEESWEDAAHKDLANVK